jgi:hemerythrin
VGSEIYFTGIIKDMSDIQMAQNEIMQLNRQNTRIEYKYQKYINELTKLLDENNIGIPELEGTTQKLIENTNAMLLGKDSLDHARIEIIQSLNTAYQHALAENLNKSLDVFNHLIKQFKDYFKVEEDIVTQNEYEDIKEHKKYHKKITIKLLEYKDHTKHSDFVVLYDYFDEIKQLVEQHFENEDKNIAAFLT